MINRDIAIGATALNQTLQAAPQELPALVPLFAVSLELCRREFLLHLWRGE